MKIKIYTSLMILLWLFGNEVAYSQTAGDYQSLQSGNWAEASTWERFDGFTWVAATAPPTAIDGVITIQAFHTVTVVSSVTADQIFIQEDGALGIDNGGHLIVNNGAEANDLEVELFFFGGLLNVNNGGVLENRGNIVTPDGTAFVNAGAIYTHNQNGGNILLASWDPTSTCNITGITSTLPSQLSQNFGHFTWSCPAQSGTIDLAGNLTRIAGDLKIQSTNTKRLALANSQTATINIAGNFEVSGSSTTAYITNSGNVTLNVIGDFNYSSPSTFIMTGSGSAAINVNGNVGVTAGTIRFVQVTSGTPTARLNLKGNFNFSGATFSTATNSGATAAVTFEGSALQTYTRSSSTISGKINFTANSNSIVNLGTSVLNGDGNFTLQTGAEIQLASTSTAGAITDQIAVLGTKSYANGGTITLNGSSLQYIGAGFPNAALNLNINNPAGVNLSDNLLIGNGATLNLVQGNLNLGNRTLTFNGSLTRSTGNLVFDGSSSIIISKSNAFGDIPYAANSTLGVLTINGASTTANLTNNLTVNTLTFDNGSSLSVGANKLSLIEKVNNINGGFNTTSSSIIEVGANVDPINNALGSLTFLSGNTVSEFIINRPGGSVDLPTTLNVASALRLQNGTLNNTVGSLNLLQDATIYKNAGTTLSNVPNIATFYNIEYAGTLTTGNELISGSTSALNNITLTAGAVVTLDPNITSTITINGTLQNDGNLDLGSETVAFKGNIINNSPLTPGNSNAIFSGTTQLSGSRNVRLYNVEITGSLTASSTNSLIVGGNLSVSGGTFNPGTGTTAFNGTEIQNVTSAGQSFYNVEILSGAAGISLQDNMDANGALTTNGPLNLNTFSFNVGGNITLNTAITAGIGSQLIMDGDNQTITSNGHLIGSALTIAGTGTKSLGSSLILSRGLTISSTLSATSGNFSITVGGNWANNGSFQPFAGTVNFNGNTQQNISGTQLTTFHNIRIQNTTANGVVLQNAVNLRGTLTLADLSNGAKINTNGHLTLLSTSDNGLEDARIAAIPSTAVFNGGVHIQRYMSGEGRFYRYLTSPVSGATVASWQDDFKIIGNFTGSSAGYRGTASMYYYNEPTTGTIDQGWLPYPPSGTSNAQPLAKGVGYAAFIDEGNAPVVIDVSGPIYQGNHTLSLAYTNTGDANADGWNLIGNIYPSQIDWAAVPSGNFVNTSRAFYVTDGGDGGTVKAWVDGTGTNTGNGDSQIAMGQGFYVRTTGANPSITFTESIKTSTSAPFYRKAAPSDYVRIALKQGNKKDESIIRFKPEATDAFDEEFDALKFPNSTVFNLFSLNAESKFAINTLKEIGCGTIVPLAIENALKGQYSFEFTEFKSFTEDVEIYLIDKFTSTKLNVLENGNYSFSITEDPASLSKGRFEVEIKKAAINNEIELSGNKVCVGDGLSVSLKSSQAGVQYQAFNGNTAVSDIVLGNGNKVSLLILAELLPLGNHSFQIKAFREGCESTFLANNYSVTVEQPYEINEVQNGSRCESGAVELSANGAPENGSYRWYSSADASSPLAETTTEPFITPEISRTRYYYVAAVNAQGCEGNERREVKAEIINLEQPTIHEDKGTLYSSMQEGNQWIKDGVKIDGATGSSFSPSENGNYTLEYSNGFCTVGSTAYNFQLLKTEEDIYQAGISFRPNPVQNNLNLRWTNPESDQVRVKIISTTGTIVNEYSLSVKNDQLNSVISVEHLAQGFYILHIQGNNSIYQLRFIKN